MLWYSHFFSMRHYGSSVLRINRWLYYCILLLLFNFFLIFLSTLHYFRFSCYRCRLKLLFSCSGLNWLFCSLWLCCWLLFLLSCFFVLLLSNWLLHIRNGSGSIWFSLLGLSWCQLSRFLGIRSRNYLSDSSSLDTLIETFLNRVIFCGNWCRCSLLC